MPSVSVIVPVYNVERYIEKCLESLINQTLEDMEIIIVNDGSKDESEKIVEKYINKYPEKFVYLKKENGGLSDARNYAIPYAKGEYIAFLDSDDYIEKETYQKMYDLAKKENSDMVECDFIWEYPNKKRIDTGIIYNEKSKMLQEIRVVAWNKLIKTDILKKTKIQFPKGYRYEDVEFTYKLIPYLEKVSFIKEPLIHYVQRDGSISNFQNEKTKDIFDVLEHVINYYKGKKIYNEYKEELEYIYIRYSLCSSLLRMVKIKDKNIKKELLNMTWEKLNTKFPDWKKNKLLRKNRTIKGLYMKTVNKVTFNVYCKIFSLL